MNRMTTKYTMVLRMVAAATLALGVHSVRADVLDEPDLKEEIVLRCHYQMGEFGVPMVQRCIETDNDALRALAAYPKTAKPIISRCAGQMRGNGWDMIKTCADKDIEADAALAGYPAEHADTIELCRADVKNQGAAKVKACVDQRAAGKAPDR
jgi:hypothetical protein